MDAQQTLYVILITFVLLLTKMALVFINNAFGNPAFGTIVLMNLFYRFIIQLSCN